MFEKKKFKQILSKIFNRYDSITEFANISGVSRTYLSQYSNLALDKAPTPKVLEKIASNSKGVTTYEELMNVCGYITSLEDMYKKIVDDNIESLNKLNLSEYDLDMLKHILEKSDEQYKSVESKLLDFVKEYNKDKSEEIYNTSIKIYNKIKSFRELYTNNYTNKNYIRIPVIGKIPAGVPIEAIEDILDYEDISLDTISKDKEYFGLRITGDSMEPNYLDGDILIVCQQNTCENGQDCVVMVNGHDATFKRVYKNENGITLQPLNNKYAPVFYSNEDIEKLPVKIIGVPIEFRRSLR